MASTSEPNNGVPLPLTPAQKSTYLDNGIWYTLALWPALTVAVQNNFGGPDSSEKRDWMAGAVSELFVTHPHTDHDDLVIFLLQIMTDEFDVQVEDDSEEEVAGGIMVLRQKIVGEGDLTAFKALEARWKARGKVKVEFQVQDGEEEDGEEWSSEEEEEDEEMRDVGREDVAPQLVPKREKAAPEIDDDGFEKVTSKKKR